MTKIPRLRQPLAAVLTVKAPRIYTVTETLKSCWVQTSPKPFPPGTYTFTAVSGVDQSSISFGNRQA